MVQVQETMRTDLKQAVCAWRCACWRVHRLHPCELLRKVPHVKFILQLWLEWTWHLLLCQVRPAQSLLGTKVAQKEGWIRNNSDIVNSRLGLIEPWRRDGPWCLQPLVVPSPVSCEDLSPTTSSAGPEQWVQSSRGMVDHSAEYV